MKVTKTEREVRYNLEMTEIEARFLFDVMSRVGGCPEKSRRYLADRFNDSLGFSYQEDNINGHLVCEDEV